MDVLFNPNIPKVVIDHSGKAIYFSQRSCSSDSARSNEETGN
ncbi:MAG: 3-deoxy-manno-octulosonate cytidylyltransferase, partial [Parapedobacter sp.]